VRLRFAGITQEVPPWPVRQPFTVLVAKLLASVFWIEFFPRNVSAKFVKKAMVCSLHKFAMRVGAMKSLFPKKLVCRQMMGSVDESESNMFSTMITGRKRLSVNAGHFMVACRMSSIMKHFVYA
jgi:hypothetical protein